MKYFIPFSLLLFVFIASSFLPIHDTTPEQAIKEVSNQFHIGLSDFEHSIKALVEETQGLENNPAAILQLQQIHLDNRLNFKKIELFLEYFDRYSVKKMLNGAPLLSVEPKVPEVSVIEPSGLQVLDELIFSENPYTEKAEILKQAQQLKNDYKKIHQYQKKIKFTHRFIFEASRNELIRVFTLGITGFDTPGSVNALPEAIVSMQSIAMAMQNYILLAQDKNPELAGEVGQLFSGGINYLKTNQDFDSFDRMHYLRNYIDPLYGKLYQLQKALQIETVKETNANVLPVNYEVESIFDKDFLNKSFYSNIDFNQENIQKRIELGKLLFFDPVLSSNLERSCASCHQPEKAFTDGAAKSIAFSQKGSIKRNAPTIINSVYAERYFYDLREPNLERQIKHVVLDTKEFSTDFFTIIDKLSQSEEYKKLFAEAYPEYPKYQLSKFSISDALACYVTSVTSFNSPVDQYIRKEIDELNPDVIAGFNLFMGKAACGTCHFAPTFNGTVPPVFDESESEVLGVPLTKDTINPVLDTDWGRAHSKRPIDETAFYKHSFKTVTVRNIAKTAPYMHNGVYDTLEEVVDFYNKGGGIGLGLDVPYQTLPDTPLNLSEKEKAQLVKFMEALSDETLDISMPAKLPEFEKNPSWNERVIGGKY